MSLASDIRNLPLTRRETPSDVLAEVARREMEARRGERPASREREPGRSQLGASREFSDYYGSGALDDS